MLITVDDPIRFLFGCFVLSFLIIYDFLFVLHPMQKQLPTDRLQLVIKELKGIRTQNWESVTLVCITSVPEIISGEHNLSFMMFLFFRFLKFSICLLVYLLFYFNCVCILHLHNWSKSENTLGIKRSI